MLRKITALVALVTLATAASATDTDGLSIGFGRVSAGSDICTTGAMVAQEFGERRWLATLLVHGEGTCRGYPMRANVGAGIARIAEPYERLTVGFGAMVKHHGDIAVGGPPHDPAGIADRPQFCALILLRVKIARRTTGDIAHCSTAGSSVINRGDNWLVLSRHF